MHRVELKGIRSNRLIKSLYLVPNVPCGVESVAVAAVVVWDAVFLMYRVELKATDRNSQNAVSRRS